jgi:two-component system, OmpR family, osmolarity sensor histidine kinase EnvZ
MIRLIPKTFFGRNFLLLVVLIVVTQIVAFLFYAYFVQRTRIERMADLTALQINLAQKTVADFSASQRVRYIESLRAISGIRVADTGTIPSNSLPGNLLVRAFGKRLMAHLAQPESLVWHDETRSLFIRIFPDAQSAYVVIDLENIYAGPSGAALGALLATGLAALLGAFLFQRRLNRPLEQLAASARALGHGLPPASLDANAPSEIKTVSHEINNMAANLVKLNEEKTMMLAGVSHDLRTPLAKMRLSIEMLSASADQSLVQSLEKSAVQMGAIIDQFIDYARTGLDEQPLLCDINTLVRETVAQLADEAVTVDRANGKIDNVHLEIDIDDSQPLILSVRPLALARALTNLINNARHYAQPVDGSVNMITVAASITREQLTLAVLDRGPGIAREDAARLTQAFTRRDAARSDNTRSGLGLAIVDRVAKLHGGELKLELREGGGLVARIIIGRETEKTNSPG